MGQWGQTFPELSFLTGYSIFVHIILQTVKVIIEKSLGEVSLMEPLKMFLLFSAEATMSLIYLFTYSLPVKN